MSFTYVPEKRIDPDLVYFNNIAFCAALAEVSDETRSVIEDVIDLVAQRLFDGAGYKISKDTARRQASEAIAQIVFSEQFDSLFVKAIQR
jgi:hypothetical protein